MNRTYPEPKSLIVSRVQIADNSDVYHFSTRVEFGDQTMLAPYCRPQEHDNKKIVPAEDVEEERSICKNCANRMRKMVGYK